MEYPRIIQGGMGAAVSSWRLASAVGRAGAMGVVSGTALDVVHARRLADGDVGGHLRRAYEHFPVPGIAERVLARWFDPAQHRAEDDAYAPVPMFDVEPDADLISLTVLANFAEVWLAKQGHSNPIGINYLEKIQLPIPFALYGAMLAGVDYVLMGAGIPTQVPRLLRSLALGEAVSYRLAVEGAPSSQPVVVHFDPAQMFSAAPYPLAVPRFLAIVASNTLAQFLAKNPADAPHGFVVEGPVAGGHNAPPRGRMQLDELGQPIYGEQDRVDLARLAKLGLPFWLAGGFASSERVEEAVRCGAQGVQVGTAFAFCEESGFDPELKAEVLRLAAAGELEVRTDALASPSGYPFKVAQLERTVSDLRLRAERRRRCDLGFLRTLAQDERGELVYRCPAEPVKAFVQKGGRTEDTEGRACLCNALLAAVGLGQVRPAGAELPVVTAGDDVLDVARFLAPGASTYTAADVVDTLMGRRSPACG